MNLNYAYCYDQLKKGQIETSPDQVRPERKQEDPGDKSVETKTDGEKVGEASDKNVDCCSERSPMNQSELRSINELENFDDFDCSSSDTSFSDLTNSDLSDSSFSETGSIEDPAEGEQSDEEKDKPEDDLQDDLPENGEEDNGGPSKKPEIDEKYDSDYLVDCNVYSNVARFLNHSCNPNLASQPVFIESRHPTLTHMAFFTIRDIKAFTELTFNYFTPDSEKMDFDCFCKSKKCVRSKAAK